MATTYNVYRDGVKVASGLTAKSYTDTDLTPSTTYEYYVTAENEYGESDPSATVEVTTDAPHEPPAAPEGLASTAQTDTTADLEWS
ncbi:MULTISPECIES: fibronectin type III domain-containing protein [Shouchella]|jgi:chitodextrinase|uniref:Fibronectin type III domain-containing protein n=1 Tax=Shouchella rhizosphaerae TaxID=866786 RepID=A0ABZ2CWU9_9BACI|nr:fibronectin type III domain-containing protein [Shouchella clausii]MCM3314901.1 fibronectin type III domain-containing protein [Psychrobacillus sp. MER TA 17]MBU8597374.1 fibronectin type III domain-containing protein [Shouchella clausii]MCY1105867.1 fibronectin type III domain-containing protein [Shouchella clausii]PAD91617.1 hypothetical protein CHH52_13405 [Shouchella clausii]QNM43751.1 fibronectin type III domain-containing protein [Shouchella clausii]